MHNDGYIQWQGYMHIWVMGTYNILWIYDITIISYSSNKNIGNFPWCSSVARWFAGDQINLSLVEQLVVDDPIYTIDF